MQQLTPLDTLFTIETPTLFLHICDVLIFEGDTGTLSTEELRTIVEQRMHLLPPLRRRLVEVPLGMDEPYWIEDPDFDLDNHLHAAAVPAPGGHHQLAEVIGTIASRPLDRSRPLWELHVVQGLEGGRSALVAKFHHAAIDGASGHEVRSILLDTTPEPREVPAPAQSWTPDRVPGRAELLLRGLTGMAGRPLKTLEVQKRMMEMPRRLLERLPNPVRDLAKKDGAKDDAGVVLPPRPRFGPRTPFNATITADRSVAFKSVPMAMIRTMKDAYGASVNDVIISAVASGLRTWLEARDALPRKPLIVAVPVSVRTEEQRGDFGNRVSVMLADLPTHIADPIERLRATHEAMRTAKGQHQLIGGNVLADMGALVMPALMSWMSRIMPQINPPRQPIMSNLSISNLPGSPVPLYLAAHKLAEHYPVGFLANNQGLMITAASYHTNVGFGLVADPHLVPDLWGMCEMVVDGVRQLGERAGVGGE
jgi:diacylglycerol O-acyltransferase / wax synthase